MPKKLASILIILISTLYAHSQKIKEADSTYILSYADKFVVKLNVDTQTDTYSLTNIQDGSQLRIAPNNNYRLFLSLDYQFLGLSVGFAPTFFSANREDDIKGKSSLSDFRFRAALGQWVQGIQISSVEGYYVENTGEFLANWTEGIDPYLQLPDLKYQKWGMSTSYVLNPNFSFRNVLYQTEWQKKSAGSIVPTLFYSYDRISYTFEDINRAEEDIFPIRLTLAYYYTLVIKENWFIGASLSPSAGVRFSKLKLTVNDLQTSENNVRFTNTLEGGLQLGYASRKIIFGTTFNFDVNGYREDKYTSVKNNQIYGVVYFGYRLNTPPFIDRTYNKFAKKLGI